MDADTERDIDEIVTALYRRFKDWSRRGFGPEDVTWCEVRADVVDLLRAQPSPREVALRNTLMWAFDRLSIDGGMTRKEQLRTMKEVGNVLRGRSSPAATYQPNDWDDSTTLSLARDGREG